MLYKMDSRLLCAVGFGLAGLTCFLNSRLDPSWTGETFVAASVLDAIGIAFALAGLVTTIFRNALALGALQNPANMLSLACWFQACRLFGGEIGKTVLVRYLKIQGTFHYTVLSQHVDGGWLTEERLRLLASNLFSDGSGLDDARLRAVLEMGSLIKQQIILLSISDGFTLIAMSAVVCLVLLGLLTYAPPLVSQMKEART